MKNYSVLLSIQFIATFAHFTNAHFFPNITSIPLPRAFPGNGSAWAVFDKYLGCRAGEKVDGLAELKKYLHYFGYISNSTRFTDDFDGSLESAVKIYQRNFNLDESGELDAPTIQHMMRPRCGNADIVNGTSTMAAGRPRNSSGTIRTVGRYAFFQGRPRWPEGKTELTYAFLPENRLTDAVKGVFARAFARWSDAIPMNFTPTEAYRAADIRIGFYAGDHGDGEPFDGSMGTLEHAFSPPSGHLHMDGDENWVLDGDFLASPASISTAVDLESVAVHEIGHMLGLGHSSVEEAIMYPSIGSGTRRVVLAGDDIQGIQELYGSNPNFSGPAAASNPARENDDSSGARFLCSFSNFRILFVFIFYFYFFNH